MGMGPFRCFLGFSVTYSNSFSEHLERRSLQLDRSFSESNVLLLQALNSLHDAVDSALTGDAPATATSLDRGIAELGRCSDGLTAIGEGLVRTRTELFEREGVDAADPLIARERFFSVVDCDGVYRQLLAHGGALPGGVYWDELAARVRDGGARAGLRLLDRHLRELQSDLRSFAGEVESMRRLPLPELAPALHGASLGVAVLTTGFTRFLTTFTYFAILCERASELYEGKLTRPLAAMAG